MNQDVPQPTTASSCPRGGSSASATSPASSAARRQHPGWLWISPSVLLICANSMRQTITKQHGVHEARAASLLFLSDSPGFAHNQAVTVVVCDHAAGRADESHLGRPGGQEARSAWPSWRRGSACPRRRYGAICSCSRSNTCCRARMGAPSPTARSTSSRSSTVAGGSGTRNGASPRPPRCASTTPCTRSASPAAPPRPRSPGAWPTATGSPSSPTPSTSPPSSPCAPTCSSSSPAARPAASPTSWWGGSPRPPWKA